MLESDSDPIAILRNAVVTEAMEEVPIAILSLPNWVSVVEPDN